MEIALYFVTARVYIYFSIQSYPSVPFVFTAGVPGTDPLSVVSRHKKLLKWLKTAVAGVTDQELSQPQPVEDMDGEYRLSASFFIIISLWKFIAEHRPISVLVSLIDFFRLTHISVSS